MRKIAVIQAGDGVDGEEEDDEVVDCVYEMQDP